MKTALINGSPKREKSVSALLLKELRDDLSEGEFLTYQIPLTIYNADEGISEIAEDLLTCDALVFAFPLYADGLPGHVTAYLRALEAAFAMLRNKQKQEKTPRVYGIVNCGFYEGKQTHLALDMMKLWCEKAKIDWGQGVGVGAGGMVYGLRNIPAGQGPKKAISGALRDLSEQVGTLGMAQDQFVSPGIPRILYKLAGEMGWRNQVKANGLTRRDLFTKRTD
ncbi:MAG: hypothetical protein PWQ12_1666 [Clostridiales bacterium]|jgi:multimeric flavodoxin WrbA|nr:hypothetical protein [Clostridiales bacterium]